MTYVPARRFCVAESIRHKQRAYGARGKWPCVASRVFDYIDAGVNACWMDFYGVLQKDHLILGNDHLMNLVAGYSLASRGESALIVDDYEAPNDLLIKRYKMQFPGMDELVSEALGMRVDCALSLADRLIEAINGFVSADGEQLIHQLEGATLMHEVSQDKHCFWAESTNHHVHSLGIASLRFWNAEKLELYGGEIGKCPQFRAEFNKIVLTSSCQYSRLNGNHIPTVAIGDAKTPLADFDYYRGSDRLRELLDAIKVFNHGQDVPASD